eukprot:GEMP01068013.1.p1 GENE.GEMP01068013.1~~GEMP01068013.1.p1  ORF type:complete len:101 (-),score=0.91 GEMP01068013.1:35-337(-)
MQKYDVFFDQRQKMFYVHTGTQQKVLHTKKSQKALNIYKKRVHFKIMNQLKRICDFHKRAWLVALSLSPTTYSAVVLSARMENTVIPYDTDYTYNTYNTV